MDDLQIHFSPPPAQADDIILSLTATSGGEATAVLSLQDVACSEGSSEEISDGVREWIKEQCSAVGHNASQVAFVHTCTIKEGQGTAVVQKLLTQAFHILHHVKSIMLLNQTPDASRNLANHFNLLASHGVEPAHLHMCSRNALLPPMKIRQARVEDCEDLLPILQRAQANYPDLAQLPEWCTPEENFALARVIEHQDDANCVLVAATGRKLVGFMVCSSGVDLEAARSTFDLHSYDNLMTPEEYTAEHQTAIKVLEDQGSEISEDIIQSFMRDLKAENRSSNAFAVSMLCMDEPWHMQAREFLQSAFDSFPDKDFCIFTLGHETPEPPLASIFNRVFAFPIPLLPSPEILFLFHRSGLIEDIQCMPAASEHAQDIVDLTDGTLDIGSGGAAGVVVAVCEGTVVGVLKLTKDVDADTWSGDFDLRGIARNGQQPDRLARVDLLRMNPIFAHRCRELIMAGMEEEKAKALVYEVSPKQPPPDFTNYFRQIPGRHKRLATEKFGNFALLGITKNVVFENREMINSQIVVVGPSECGLSTIERLLLDEDLFFTSITLLVPEGVKVGGVGNTLTGRNLVKLGLECRITLLAAEVVSLDRESRVIGLSNGEDMNYDYLVLTAGLQDQTRCHLQRTAQSKFSSVVTVQELLADSSKGLPERRQNVIVYGAEIDAYHALSLLESRGSPRERVRHVVPDGVVSPMGDCLKGAAGVLGLGLPDTTTMTLVEVEETEEGKLICSFEVKDETTGELKNVDEQCDVLVACDAGDINPSLFQCINESSIVYDGRLVVNHNFQTNDPRVFGGGSLARFSRSVHPCLKMEMCNSREVGHKLGESLVRHFKLNSLAVTAEPSPEPTVPDFSMSKAVGCTLPGGAFFVFAGTKEAMAAPSIEAEKLNLTPSRVVSSAIYCGRMRVSAPRLSCIVGLPSTYLNGIVEKYDNKDVSDLMLFLHGGWAEALYHDRFSELRTSILKHASEKKQQQGSESESDDWTQSHVQAQLQDFIKANLNELPAYTITA